MTIFEQIKNVHATTTGWCSEEKALTLAAIVLAARPKICVEIGVWHGKSLFPVALAAKHIGDCRVIAVDPWSAPASVDGQVNPADVEWWNRPEIHEQAFQSFRNKVTELGLNDTVKIVRQSSDEFDPPESIGLLSVDGNHGDQAIMDIRRYAPKVARGGYLVADDVEWTGGAVGKAISLLPSMGFMELYRVKNDKGAV